MDQLRYPLLTTPEHVTLCQRTTRGAAGVYRRGRFRLAGNVRCRHVGVPQEKETGSNLMTVVWSRLKDATSWKRTRAHLVQVPIVDQHMADCGYRLDGHEWTAQEPADSLERCGRCQEAERNWLKGKVG